VLRNALRFLLPTVSRHIMTRMLKILFCFFSLTTQGQTEVYREFKKTDYDNSKYLIKVDTFKFIDYNILLTQVKLKDYGHYEPNSTYCRIWLTVMNKSKKVDSLFFNSCEGLGGCSGIYASKDQPLKNYFILSKFGDYDGRVLIIGKTGKINSYYGGHYFISNDKKYLFSPYSSDINGLTVFDLVNNKLLYSSDTVRGYISTFYLYNNKYFAVIENDEKKQNETEIITFNFQTNDLIYSTVDSNFVNNADKLKGYNIFTYAPCDCGQRNE
jgi:hypothetical protein